MPSTTTKDKVVIIIPARMASERFPGKPLFPIDGKPMIHMVYDLAKKTIADEVLVATSDMEILAYCIEKEISFVNTTEEHCDGTHRVAEAYKTISKTLGGFDLVVNIQCDEPFINPKHINDLIEHALTCGGDIWTIVAENCICPEDENTTKVVVSELKEADEAIWFSRALMAGANFHCGIYAYKPEILFDLSKLKQTMLSKAEKLEQLTWLEHRYEISTLAIPSLPQSINTKEDCVDLGEPL